MAGRGVSGVAAGLMMAIAGPAVADDAADCQAMRPTLNGAIAACTRVIDTETRPIALAAAYNSRGIAYIQADHSIGGDYVRAIEDLTRAAELSPKDHLIVYNRGHAHALAGDLEAAWADFDRAARLRPDFADAFYNRGLVNELRGRRAAATEDYRRALSRMPADAANRQDAESRLARLAGQP